MSTYKSVVLANRPKASIVLGETFRVESKRSPTEADLKDGQVIFKTLYLSLDPAMRGWLNDVRSYLPPIKIGQTMRGSSIGQVSASKSSTYPVGSLAHTHAAGWSELSIVNAKDLDPLPTPLPSHIKASDYLGPLGLTGLTAYFGLLNIGQPKPGNLCVVSGAAGATGSIAGQIAKIYGCRVVGIAGSDSKCRWLESELGFDRALNYKSTSFRKDFRELTKEKLIDVFFDNVGGDILDLALARAAQHSRFVMCGGISQYNNTNPRGPLAASFLNVISSRIKMQGFIVMDYADQYAKAQEDIGRWLGEGKIKRKETVVKGGLDNAEQGLVDLFDGKNTGKMLVEVAPLEEQGKSSRSKL